MAKIPNWCSGYVTLKGKAKDIENFCKLFLFDRKNEDDVPEKYFARSFVQEKWEDFKKDMIDDYEAEEETEISFSVDFAWSVWSCLIEGYPNNKECVTLKWACKNYNVCAEIESEESDMGFEEKVICDKGETDYSSKEMPKYICQNCNSEQIIPSSCDLKYEECGSCEAVGKWEDELKELILEKLK